MTDQNEIADERTAEDIELGQRLRAALIDDKTAKTNFPSITDKVPPPPKEVQDDPTAFVQIPGWGVGLRSNDQGQLYLHTEKMIIHARRESGEYDLARVTDALGGLNAQAAIPMLVGNPSHIVVYKLFDEDIANRMGYAYLTVITRGPDRQFVFIRNLVTLNVFMPRLGRHYATCGLIDPVRSFDPDWYVEG